MKRYPVRNLLIITVLLFVSCKAGKQAAIEQPRSESSQTSALNAVIQANKQKYVPDARENVYEIKTSEIDGKTVLKGFTSVPEAKRDLLADASRDSRQVIDSITILPDATVGEEIYGVVNVSVADMRTGPDYSEEMATQLLLGAPVKVLQRRGWWRVKSAENYVAWMPGGSFTRMTKAKFNEWIAAPKIIFTDTYGFAYELPDETKPRYADLVFGNMLRKTADAGRFWKVAYPDGETAYVLKTQSREFEEWKKSVKLTEESIIEKALSLKGIPYTWGGTSTKMMDCSGFSKTVFLMHGIMLLRDASQQATTGIPIDISAGYDKLRAGDLMFFGRKGVNGGRDRVRHVGIYKGNLEFIHEAGKVQVSSLDPSKPHYDSLNTREFISAVRIIGAVGTKGIWEIEKNPLYREQE